jgi:hypothetical protein
MNGADGQDVYYLVMGVLGVVGWGWFFYTTYKRKLALQQLGTQHGWSYRQHASHLARLWTGPPFRSGFGPHPDAGNALVGDDPRGRPLVVFDYRPDDKHAQTVIALQLPCPRPAGTVPRPGDRNVPHDPPLRFRFDGRDVLCWSDKLLRPEQILPAVTWLGSRADSMLAAAAAAPTEPSAVQRHRASLPGGPSGADAGAGRDGS